MKKQSKVKDAPQVPKVRSSFADARNATDGSVGSTDKDVREQAQSSDSADTRAMGREYRASEEFRAICEAQYVLSKPIAWRRQYLEDVGRIRGAAGRAYIEKVIREEWKKKATPKSG